MEPGDADLPVEECAESAGALFPLCPVEGGARLREHVALELALGLAEANRFLQARMDDGVVGKTKSAQDCAHKQLLWGNLSNALEG
jgi:hypothetical protein